ncbi:DoxX family protein [Nocardia huaxiensis]|uniref:DoxX family protein n=1 Tax=Nocardia huaxiensis TaxID=2755382 RepID=A0A7D6ZPJ1_9NOCA|nr:DoxX family protein [Nocardia huaxiensis]QLY30505.1 DoxX family protein [Nocardia huaxiensis]UFS95897.1 DoxX family protein [Nocardia huaxiensis]
MAPLIVLLVVTGSTRLAGWLGLTDWLDSWPHAARLGLAAMFLLTASAHFLQPRRNALIAMLPPRLPAPAALVTLTGVLETAGAVGLLIPFFAPAAALCLAVLMVVMFPANVHAARSGQGIKTMPLPLRTVVQIVFIGTCVLAAF